MDELIDDSIETSIIKILAQKPIYTIELIRHIQTLRPNTTKQGVYLALRKLKKKEAVTIVGKIVSLNQVWLEKTKEFLLQAEQNYFKDSNSANFFELKDKENITYSFNNLVSLDIFWGHAFALLLRNMRKGKEVLLYNPHEWFLISRNKSEVDLMQGAKSKELSWICLIAGKTKLDLEAKKYFDNKFLRGYFLGKDEFETNYYVNCFEDILIEVWLDKKITFSIDAVYKDINLSEKEAKSKIDSILEIKNTKNKMRISRNTAKANRLRRVFGKYFVY